MPGLKPPSPALSSARRAVEKAFKDLESTIEPAESRDFSSTTLDDVRKAAIEIERQLAARQSLRNTRRLDPLFKGLEHYAKVIEVLANGTDYLPWIWAPIKLILKIAADYVEAFERIIKAYAHIADSLRRFQLLERSFQGTPDIYPTFVVFYADILSFHKAAYRFVTRPCWKLLFLTAWGRFKREFDDILENLNRHGKLIDKEAYAHNIVEARQERQSLEAWRTESLASLAQTQREQTARQLQGLTTWLRVDDSEQLSLLDGLTEVGAKHPGTVSWVLGKKQMSAWLRPTSESQYLWLHGGPGTGKSVISARLIAFLATSGKSLVVHHFCSYTYSSSTLYDQVLKSLLLQCLRGDAELVNYIYEEYVGTKPASPPVLEKLLETVVEALSSGGQGHKTIHIVLDGLEELAHDSQERLMRLLERLMTAGASCKVLVSSRDSPRAHVKKKKPSLLSLADEKAAITEAMTRFAATELESMREQLDQLRVLEEDRRQIASGISIRADGMFLWARLVLNFLTANLFYSREEFIRAADTLPRELSKFYEKLLARIVEGLDSRSILRLRLIFGWISSAKRPFRKAELQSALLFHQDDSIDSNTAPVPAYVLDKCKPLIHQFRDHTLGFIHVSVKEYLENHVWDKSIRLDPAQVLLENGVASLRCIHEALRLFSGAFSETTKEVQIAHGNWGFIPYATEFWCVMLEEIFSTPVIATDPRLSAAAEAVNAVLKELRSTPSEKELDQDRKPLEPLKQFACLWHEAVIALQAREAGRSRPKDDENQGPIHHPKHIHHVFTIYEAFVQRLTGTYEHEELTHGELSNFRDNFSVHAYTCGFWSCPHAWEGFKSREERFSHESAHLPAFPCLETGCQYPPFGSKAGLRKHHNAVHVQQKPTPKLRRINPQKRSRSISPTPSIFSPFYEDLLPHSPGLRPLSLEDVKYPIPTRYDILPLAHIGEAGMQAKSAISMSPEPDRTIGRMRVTVYELRNNDWFSRGVGFCTADVVTIEAGSERREARITVKAEDSPFEKLLLDTAIVTEHGFHKQQDSLIVWTENDVDMALSFQQADCCQEVWEFIDKIHENILRNTVFPR
ncbi:hypothetical protein QBC47DRAFT_84133 [Echria macrotheca]|uniref:NACHT domain-containing protein n=1 Tax=Echria macrotheca TaxID=438768 RepID=A0AAJ0B3N7_9PEZI|nr:hypothetical protein QBC47DRAFT_84133 [Echria macrotheca]